MPYLIDGHNLIGQLPDVSLDDPNDEALLVQKLTAFAARTGKRCTVVFDTGLPGGKSRMSTGVVEVVFASPPANADKVLMERIGNIRDPRNWTIVSSDNVVLDAGRQRGMKAVKSADFAGELRPVPKQPPPRDDKPMKDVRVSPQEVDEWLRLFEERKKKK